MHSLHTFLEVVLATATAHATPGTSVIVLAVLETDDAPVTALKINPMIGVDPVTLFSILM